ncbi:MAG: DNA recombination protein RmuC [Erysipelotrichaceae bacterium]|nr:DNA recombination protein RmuC [Erysipelotrichaceae bacterium]
MEITMIILSSLCLVAVIVLIFVIVKRKPVPTETKIDLKEIGALEKQIDLLSTQIKGDIELAVVKEMNKVSDQTVKNSEMNNDKLERFQKNIAEALNTRFDALNKQMEDKITLINKKVDEKLSEGFKSTNESMTQVRERLQAIDAAQKNIENLSKDVVSLKQVLEGNQSRGQYGEYQLSMVLHNVFGDTEGCYQEQYTMKKVKDGDDVRADAVVFMPEPNRMICIDSKFPFQDYAKVFDAQSEEEKDRLTKDFANAVKKHITAIKDKYIVDGKTAPEALMFIPNDGVFAFIHHNCQDVIEYARDKKVILTSPSTLPAILVTINMVKIQAERAKNVEEINRQLHRLSKDFEMFGREWNKFSDDLEKTSKSREKLDTRVNKINNKFDAIRGNEKLDEIEESHDELFDDNETMDNK